MSVTRLGALAFPKAARSSQLDVKLHLLLPDGAAIKIRSSSDCKSSEIHRRDKRLQGADLTLRLSSMTQYDLRRHMTKCKIVLERSNWPELAKYKL